LRIVVHGTRGARPARSWRAVVHRSRRESPGSSLRVVIYRSRECARGVPYALSITEHDE
jgi:hypothetical protein